MDSHCSEKSFVVNGLALAALHWKKPGSRNARKVLCLHGWLDNAKSFSQLAPLLDAEEVIAFDLAGHGMSSHRSADASYNIWEDIEEILGVADLLEWQRFTLVGHSRGGTIAIQLAALFPERVDRLVTIDAYFLYSDASQYIPQMRKYLLERKKYSERVSGNFSSQEEALQQRLTLSDTELEADELRELVLRNLRKTDKGYRWSYDSRLRGASAIKLLQEFINSILESLQTPTLVISAERGVPGFEHYRQLVEEQLAPYPLFSIHDIKGGHHLHMERGLVSSVATAINAWLNGRGENGGGV